MTRIPQKERDKIEQAIYLPMVLTILERDLVLFQKGPFKKSPESAVGSGPLFK